MSAFVKIDDLMSRGQFLRETGMNEYEWKYKKRRGHIKGIIMVGGLMLIHRQEVEMYYVRNFGAKFRAWVARGRCAAGQR
jgi:hypothetical protein